MSNLKYEKFKRLGGRVNYIALEIGTNATMDEFKVFLKSIEDEKKKERTYDYFIFFKNVQNNITDFVFEYLNHKKIYFKDKKLSNNHITIFFDNIEQQRFFTEITMLNNLKFISYTVKRENWETSNVANANKGNGEGFKRNNQDTFSKNNSKTYDRVEIQNLPVFEYQLSKLKNPDIEVSGTVFEIEKRDIGRSTLFEIKITNEISSVLYKEFVRKNMSSNRHKISEGDQVTIRGTLQYDEYSDDLIIMGDDIEILENSKESNVAIEIKEKERFESHLYTNFSTMDGLTNPKEYFEYASKNNIKGLIFSDRENIQSYPEVYSLSKKYPDIKVGYGVDLMVKNISEDPIFHSNGLPYDGYVGLDLETTGFSQLYDDIIEVAAYKVKDGVTEEFSRLIKIENMDKLTEEIERLTGITKEDLSYGEDIKSVLNDLKAFIGNSVIVAHNATFDIGFLKQNYLKHFGEVIDFNYLDTLNLSRSVLADEMKRFNLAAVGKKLGVELEDHHRGLSDAKTAYNIFEKLMELIKVKEVDVTVEKKFFTDVFYSGKANYENLIKKIEEHDKLTYVDKVDETKRQLTGILTFELDFDKFEILNNVIEEINKKNVKFTRHYIDRVINNLSELNDMFPKLINFRDSFAVTVLAKNQDGLKSLFELVSISHTDKMEESRPLIDMEDIEIRRENLLIGTSFVDGSFKILFNKGLKEYTDTIEKINYDFIEIAQPNHYLGISNSPESKENVLDALSKIISSNAGKLIVSSSAAYYTEEKNKEFRKILVGTPAVGGIRHYLSGANEIGDSKLLKSSEIDKSFLELKEYDDFKNNDKELFNLFDKDIQIIKDGLYTPKDNFLSAYGIKSVSEKVTEMVTNEVKKYADKNGEISPYVKERFDRELNSIIENNFATIYYISYMLVNKSIEDGYSVGSRGSVGSSFIAYLMGITEVNPLRPHYRCSEGHYSIFKPLPSDKLKFNYDVEEKIYKDLLEVESGFDLEEQVCPICSKKMIADGHDIPFETFLGFKGDKVPDIDLNFSGEYQSKAHDYTREIFGENYAFRAGTISTVAERTAFGMVRGFYEKSGQEIRKTEIQRRAKFLQGVKRTTGQHPGGIIVIPDDLSIHDFTPYQFPANKADSTWKTTHFDFNAIHDNVLKLDILGHDDPTILRALMADVEENPNEYPFKTMEEIPLNDKKVISMLNMNDHNTIRSIALPEFGTNFVREMLKDTNPQNFAELVKVSGLSHGTDVWLNNAKDLVSGNLDVKIEFSEVIGCRDDIMVYLINRGLSNFDSFEIMEFVRKGKPNKDKEQWEKYKTIMKENNVPDWYIWSCEQIKYMFPKAHATAYVMSAMRIAWFKQYKPLQFYATYFSVKSSDFDLKTILSGKSAISKRIREITSNKESSDVERRSVTILEVAYEALDRGIIFKKPDLKVSKQTEFITDKKEFALISPLTSIPGLGMSVANKIVEVQDENLEYLEIKKHSSINKTVEANMLELEMI